MIHFGCICMLATLFNVNNKTLINVPAAIIIIFSAQWSDRTRGRNRFQQHYERRLMIDLPYMDLSIFGGREFRKSNERKCCQLPLRLPTYTITQYY